MSSADPPPERRTAPRASGQDAWSSVRRDAWRTEAFQAHIAFEAKQRREPVAKRYAIRAGLVIGLIGAGVQLFMRLAA